MKKVMAVAAATAIGFLISNSRAAVLSGAEIANFKLTYLVQAPTTTNKDAVTFITTKVKITNKDILTNIANAFGTNFPVGAQLAIDDGGNFYVVDSTGTNVIVDVSTDAPDGTNCQFFVTFGNYVYSGHEVDTNNSGSEVYYDQASVTLFNQTNVTADSYDISFNGLDTYKFSEDSKGKFKESDTIVGSGSGTNGDTFEIITGTITANGAGID